MGGFVTKTVSARAFILIFVGAIVLALMLIYLSFEGLAFPREKSSPGISCGDPIPGRVTLFFSDDSSLDEVRAFVTDELMEKRGFSESDLQGTVMFGESDFEQLFDSSRRSATRFTVTQFPDGRQELGRLMVERKNALRKDERVEKVYYSDTYFYRGRWSTTRHIYGIILVDSSGATKESFIQDHPEIFPMPDFLTLNLQRELEETEEKEAKDEIDYYMDFSLKDDVEYVEQVLARLRQNTEDVQTAYSEGLFLNPTFTFSLPTSFSMVDIAEIVTQAPIPEGISWTGKIDPLVNTAVEIFSITGLAEGTEQKFIEEMQEYPEIDTAFQNSVVCHVPF